MRLSGPGSTSIFRLGTVAAIVLALVAGKLTAEQPTRRVRGTEHFRIAYWPSDEDQAVIAAQAATVALQRLQYSLDVKLPQRIEIALCHTQKEFNERVGVQSAPWIIGRAFPAELRVVVKAIGPARIGKLVAHELCHVLLQYKLEQTGAPAPRWLHEGLAKYATGDLPMDEQQLLAKAATTGKLLSLDELEAAFEGPVAQVSLAYAQSYTLVEYLSSLAGRKGISTFLEELGQVGDVNRALVRAYQMPVPRLEEQWLMGLRRTYLGRRGPGMLNTWTWTAIAALFIVAVIVQLRRAARIRRRLQEEERLYELLEGIYSGQSEFEEAE